MCRKEKKNTDSDKNYKPVKPTGAMDIFFHYFFLKKTAPHMVMVFESKACLTKYFPSNLTFIF